ncbi:EbsA family protein [Pseudobutyrivibrio xylanivorans]|uniref:Uncharacterized protein n=1 Tax=Pseudobutyrivibrio xylanivorans TaxID=185007 RepID=A0A1G5RZE7_PSEXY|nr:EbsA family protein [Pseudobutyrivibrio xylanivorans]SCZ79515.1 hypothetical protein SAMN02910350_01810 [Pseudobutyrivibrio xylanivorans]
MSNLLDLAVLDKIQTAGLITFGVELIVYLIDRSISNYNEEIVVVRPRKVSAYLGMFMSLFAVWVCHIVADSCKNEVDVYMLAGLGIFIIIFGAFLVLIRLNNFYTYVLEDDKIVIYKMFIFKREISLKEIDKIEQKSDGIKIYLKNQRKIFIDYMFDNQESLKKELRGNGIYLC